jgi:hypothetical protein
MFASFFQNLLTELEGNFRFRLGGFSIGFVTVPGSNNFAITVSPFTPATPIAAPQAAAAIAKSTASL